MGKEPGVGVGDAKGHSRRHAFKDSEASFVVMVTEGHPTWADEIGRRWRNAKRVCNVGRGKVVHFVVENNAVGRDDLASPVEVDGAGHGHRITVGANDWRFWEVKVNKHS